MTDLETLFELELFFMKIIGSILGETSKNGTNARSILRWRMSKHLSHILV
jgi:hypothetical protein